MTVTERTAEYRKALDVPISQLETDRIVKEILDRPENFDNIYRLTSDDKLLVSWRALWICDKLCRQKPEWLIPFREELTGRLMSCGHDGSKRLLLSILYHAPATKVPSVALLNFCLDAMLSPQERSACNRSPSEWLTACASPSRSCCMSCVPYWRVQKRKCIRPP